MREDHWRLVRERFEAVIELPPTEVEPWLRAHETDADVRLEVASLLAHHSRAGAFLESPIGDLREVLGTEPALVSGQQLGPYVIVREAGRGGMGRVYQATDERLGRSVALKALPPEVAQDATQRERLRREARALATLTHPGICTVYALEEFAGELYMVAEFVEGETLRDEMSRGPLPTSAAVVAVARELAAALASAHAKGVAHRDLKPENVMRAADGRLKVLDFGLARVEAAGGHASHVTQPGALIGTPAYLSPEQLNGQPADARTDVFALGVLLYEYACGVHPFEAATPLARAGRVLEAEPEPLGLRRRDLPSWLVEPIDRCLRKRPADRFATAGEVAVALERRDGSPQAMPLVASQTQATVEWWRRHQLVLILLYLVASVLAWQVKEWRPGVAGVVFIGVGVAAAVGGVIRSHLLFTERMHRAALRREQRRLAPVTFGIDLLLACAVAGDGLVLAPIRPVAAVLVLGLAVGLGLARLVLEPATTRAAFPSDH